MVELGLQVLLGHRVAAQSLEREHVVPHELEVLAGFEQVGAFGIENGDGRVGIGGFPLRRADRGHDSAS